MTRKDITTSWYAMVRLWRLIWRFSARDYGLWLGVNGPTSPATSASTPPVTRPPEFLVYLLGEGLWEGPWCTSGPLLHWGRYTRAPPCWGRGPGVSCPTFRAAGPAGRAGPLLTVGRRCGVEAQHGWRTSQITKTRQGWSMKILAHGRDKIVSVNYMINFESWF